MGGNHEIDEALLAQSGERGKVPIQDRLERLPVRQFRVGLGEYLGAVEHESRLHIYRLLGPERAVVVEGGDALLDRHEIRTALARHPFDESGDGRFGAAVVPGRKRIGLRLRHACRERQGKEGCGSDEGAPGSMGDGVHGVILQRNGSMAHLTTSQPD